MAEPLPRAGSSFAILSSGNAAEAYGAQSAGTPARPGGPDPQDGTEDGTRDGDVRDETVAAPVRGG